MKGFLYLVIRDTELLAGFGAGGRCFFSSRLELTVPEGSPEKCIHSFLDAHNLKMEQVAAVVVLREIRGLFSRLIADPGRTIGYLQVSQEHSEPVQFLNRLEHSGCRLEWKSVREDEPPETLRTILSSFRERGVRELAVNGYYSPLRPRLEQEYAVYLDKLTPCRFSYSTPEAGIYQPYLLKENKLLINTILKEPLKAEWTQLDKICGGKTILFCCGDGSVRDRQTVEENPLMLWQSETAHLLRGASREHELDTFIALQPHWIKGVSLSLMKEGEPLANRGSRLFSGLPIIHDTLWTTSFKEWPTTYKLFELFNAVNPSQGPVPLLNGTGQELPFLSLSWRSVPLGSREPALLRGMASAPFRSRHYRFIRKQSDHRIIRAKEELLEISRREREERGISLFPSESVFNLSTLKYLQGDWGLLSLETRGGMKCIE